MNGGVSWCGTESAWTVDYDLYAAEMFSPFCLHSLPITYFDIRSQCKQQALRLSFHLVDSGPGCSLPRVIFSGGLTIFGLKPDDAMVDDESKVHFMIGPSDIIRDQRRNSNPGLV